MSLNFKYSENNYTVKEITAEVQSFNDYSEYRKSLQQLKREVNEYLTSLVEADTVTAEEVQDDNLSDSGSEEDKSPKRALSNDREPAIATKLAKK